MEEQADHLFNIQQIISKENLHTDLKIICSDGNHALAHQAILAMNSEFFEKCLKTIPLTSDNICVVILPDVELSLMKKILNFLYIGEVVLSSSEITEFLEIKSFLGIKSKASDCTIDNIKTNQKRFEKSKTYQNLKDTNEIKIEEQNQDNIIETGPEDNIVEIIGDDEIFHLNYEKENYKIDEIHATESEYSTIISSYDLEELEEGNNKETPECYGYTLKNPKCSNIEEIEIDEIDVPIENENEDEIDVPIENENEDEIDVPIENENNLNRAILAILENGFSVTKAANIFNVSKTKLWHKVKNESRYKKKNKLFEKEMKEKTISEICQYITNGESLLNISKILNIPISTIHFYKVRLMKAGVLPKTTAPIKRTLRTDNKQKLNLEKAIEACKKGMTLNKAAIKFGVSKATLFRRMKMIKKNSS